MTISSDPWSEYRRLRNLMVFGFIGYVPVVMGFAFLSLKLFATFTPAFVFAIAWLAFLVIVANLTLRLLCPRCGKWFFAKWWFNNPFAQNCVHCGLPKYSDPNQIDS